MEADSECFGTVQSGHKKTLLSKCYFCEINKPFLAQKVSKEAFLNRILELGYF